MIALPSPFERFEICLARRNKRMTEQRRLIVQHVFSLDARIHADQIIEFFRENPPTFRVGRATVYRTLMELVDCGLLQQLDENGTVWYDPVA